MSLSIQSGSSSSARRVRLTANLRRAHFQREASSVKMRVPRPFTGSRKLDSKIKAISMSTSLLAHEPSHAAASHVIAAWETSWETSSEWQGRVVELVALAPDAYS